MYIVNREGESWDHSYDNYTGENWVNKDEGIADEASNGMYSFPDSVDGVGDYAEWDFNIHQAGTYKLWVRGYHKNGWDICESIILKWNGTQVGYAQDWKEYIFGRWEWTCFGDVTFTSGTLGTVRIESGGEGWVPVDKLLITSNFSYDPNDYGVGGGVGSIAHNIGERQITWNDGIEDLGYTYIHDRTEDLSDIILDVYDEQVEIAKGREFGSKGEKAAAYDLEGWFDEIGIHAAQERVIAYPGKAVDDKMNITDMSLTIDNGTEQEIDEVFMGINSSRYKFAPLDSQDSSDYSCSGLSVRNWHLAHFENAKAYDYDNNFSEFLIEYEDDILCDTLDIVNTTNATFEGTLYNVTLQKFEEFHDISFSNPDRSNSDNWNNSIPGYNSSTDGDYVWIFEDPWNHPGNYTYNLELLNSITTLIKKSICGKIYTLPLHLFKFAILTRVVRVLDYFGFDGCKGFLLYDFNNNTHNMVKTQCIDILPSFYNPDTIRAMYGLPMIFINGSIGREINESYEDYTVSFSRSQQFEDSVESYNVIGTIYGIEQNKTVILSSLYDSWWDQGTTDSAIGMSIVLGIAKYFKENNIVPRYNLKFVCFSGEEYGLLGARSYESRHKDEEIIAVIDLNQVCFDERYDIPLEFRMYVNASLIPVVQRSNYETRGDPNAEFKTYERAGGAPSNDKPFALKRKESGIQTVCFLKDTGWTLHHRDGKDESNQPHSDGDTMDYYNETYVNVVAEMILNVTKYYVAHSEEIELNGYYHWNLISVPFNDVLYPETDIFIEYDGEGYDWNDAVNNGLISEYVFGFDRDIESYEFMEQFEPGEGYWVMAFYNCTFLPKGAVQSCNPITTLDSGWNLVGVPGNDSILKTELLVEYDGVSHSWNEAVNDGKISDFVFGFENGGYCFADVIERGQGYFVYTYENCDLLFPTSSAKDGDRGDESQDNSGIWNGEMNIIQGNGQHVASVYFRESPDALEGTQADKYDAPAPPTPPEPYVYAYFDDNLQYPYHKLFGDYRTWADSDKTWNLTVSYASNNQSNTTLNLTWNASALAESEYETIRLYDNNTDTTIDMLTQEFYKINMSANTSKDFQILCSNGTLPIFENVNTSPSTGGFGENITISADVTHLVNNIDTVKVNVTYPDDTTNNYTMSNTNNDTYQYGFDDTWQTGTYHYYFWTNDTKGNTSYTKQFDFTISANASMQVCTVKNTYTGEEYINLTDPPTPSTLDDIGYELLADGDVLHMWNQYDSYYFNTSSGIQLTNHFGEYWSHNVLMLGYYNNDNWNLIYRMDELSGFQKTVDTDNQTFVNATLWKDLTYQGYEFRLAIRYHLGLMDNELTVIPYIKNLGDPIPYALGFAWEINDIRIDDTPEDDYILINDSYYWLNESLDLSFTNLSRPVYCWNETLNESVVCGFEPLPYFHIQENLSSNRVRSLYLRWNQNLNYKVQIQSQNGTYNAPVVLGIRIGSLDAGESKQTSLYWYDADQQCFYFDDYSPFETWTTNPGYMVDNDTGTFASTSIENDVEKCTGTSCPSIDPGSISKVEIRVYANHAGYACSLLLRPVFRSGDGDNHEFELSTSASWSDWFDITDDTNAPDWTWKDIETSNCDVEAYDFNILFSSTVYCAKVEIRVTYSPWTPPSITNPTPGYGSTNVSIQPRLGITVTDDNGDTLDISWLSNSSGSWQEFATNNSVGNGTYYQTFDGAVVNGQWWYWMLNVSDDHDYNLSSVFKFYTGTQSKLVNSGTTNIKGYLLMQAEFWNGTDWVVDQVVIDDWSPQCLNASEVLGLDTVFNGLLDTGNLHYGDGSYRVYAALCDPEGNVLLVDDSKLEAWWTFELDLV